jgi:hypothetical protein
MKKLTAFFIAIVLMAAFYSCYTPFYTNSERIFIISGWDFSKFLKDGFTFTPYIYQYPHDIISIQTIIFYPKITWEDTQYNDARHPSQSGRFIIESYSYREILDSIKNFAIHKGGNGFSEFKVKRIRNYKYQSNNKKNIIDEAYALDETDGLEITGNIIKIK